MKRWFGTTRWLALAVIAFAAVFNYQNMFRYTAYLFNHPLEDMSHGWVVPFVSLFVLWRERRDLRAATGRPSWMGAACVAFFLAVAWLGGRGEQSRIEQVSLIGLVWAIPYAFWGRGVERLMRFPAAYLIFTVPLSSAVDFFTVRLRMAAVSMATGVLNGLGMAVERSGTALFSHAPGGTFNVDVADPCSGIRSLFAMMTLMTAYAYFTQEGFWKKSALSVCSLPIAVIGNMVRIMSICVVASWCGQDVAMGYYHDYSGFVVFVVGVYLMFLIGDRIKKVNWRFRGPFSGSNAPPPEAAPLAVGNDRSAIAIVTGVTVVALAVFMLRYVMPAPVYAPISFVAEALPEQVGNATSDVPWFCQDPQCLTMAEQRTLKKATVDGVEGYVCPTCGKLMCRKSLGEVTILPADTVILKRNYQTADGVVYAVNVVIQGRTRASLHRAEVCLPSQGFILEKAQRVPLKLTGRTTPLVVRQIDAARSAGVDRMPVRQNGQLVWFNKPGGKDVSTASPGDISLVYWMLTGDRECCSHVQRILTDVWDRSVHNRINRWVMVAVTCSPPLDTSENRKRFEAFLSELYPRLVQNR